MKTRLRRARAFAYYVRKPLLDSLTPFLLLTSVLLGGSIAFHELSDSRPISWGESLYTTYALVFMEHIEGYPSHWLLQILYFMIPVLGLVVILDAIARFSTHVLRLDESSPEWINSMSRTFEGHVVLFGLGKVGLRVLQQLLHLGEHVVVIEKDPHSPNFAYARKHGVPCLVGSGREEGLMDNVNVAKAKSVICVTDDDLANLELAIDARDVSEHIRIVLRLFDQELAEKIRGGFGIKLAFCTSQLSAPVFATAASDRSIINAFYVGDQLLVVAALELSPESELVGRRVGELGREQRLFILMHGRDGHEDYRPSAKLMLEAGDRLTLQCDPRTLRQVHALNHDHEPDLDWIEVGGAG